MHTAVQSRLSFPEKDLSYTELFGAALPVYEEEYDGEDEVRFIEREILKGIRSPVGCETQLTGFEGRDFCSDDWEWLQEYGDISAFNEKGELYECVDINEICGNLGLNLADVDEELDGPTLAELNDGAMSPVVNPDMERLHFVALKTDVGIVAAADELNHMKQRGYLRSSWLDKPLRASSWLHANLRPPPLSSAESGDVLTARLQAQVQSTPTFAKVAKETIDENQNTVNHDTDSVKINDLAKGNRINSDNVENKENTCCFASGDPSGRQYRESEDSDGSDNDGSNENTQGNSDSEMDDDNFDSENEDDEDGNDLNYGAGRASRKSRRKETEDGAPNPKRLLEIGRQLEKLNTSISELKPVHLLPPQARTQTRREKNKLASRACRLKKKATHEANKIKLKGLAMEKDRLLCSIRDAKRFVINSYGRGSSGKALRYDKYLEMEQQLTGFQVAGNLQTFVESVLKSATGGRSFDCSTVL